MTEVHSFKNKTYATHSFGSRIIYVKSESNPNKVYEVRACPVECSCPDYERQSAPWLKGDSYICKHIRKLLNLDVPVEEMIQVIETTDGDLDVFLSNYSESMLNLLILRQLIYLHDKKIYILK